MLLCFILFAVVVASLYFLGKHCHTRKPATLDIQWKE